jgi:hypothetical protein
MAFSDRHGQLRLAVGLARRQNGLSWAALKELYGDRIDDPDAPVGFQAVVPVQQERSLSDSIDKQRRRGSLRLHGRNESSQVPFSDCTVSTFSAIR